MSGLEDKLRERTEEILRSKAITTRSIANDICRYFITLNRVLTFVPDGQFIA
jgi:high-affinity K+ transport system ATPase subunit B